eukprot:4406565-Amphidinium_carterae.2
MPEAAQIWADSLAQIKSAWKAEWENEMKLSSSSISAVTDNNKTTVTIVVQEGDEIVVKKAKHS